MHLLGVFSDFSKGNAGWVDKTKVGPGFWLGEQVQAFRDGSVGPRAGLLDLGVTGLPGGGPTLYGLGYLHPVIAGDIDYVWLHLNNGIGRVPVYNTSGRLLLAQAYTAAAGTFAAVPAGDALGDHVEYSPSITLIQVDGDKTYYVDWLDGANGTIHPIAASPSGAHLEIYNEFLIVSGGPGNSNRLRFSAPGDFTTWPAANFIDISGGLTGTATEQPKITAIKRMRDSLIAWTSIGQVFIITSISQDAATWRIRELQPGDHMSGPRGMGPVRDHSGQIWYTRRTTMPVPGDEAFDAHSAVPISFDGASRNEELTQAGWLRQPSTDNDSISRITGAAGRDELSFALMGPQGRALVNRQGAWSRHRFNPNVNGQVVTAGHRGEIFACDTAMTKLYGWQMELERPPWKNQGSTVAKIPTSDADAGGALTPPVWLATPQLRDSSLLSVKRVEVLLTSWDTAATLHNHLECAVQQYDAVDANELLDVANVFPPDATVSGSAMAAGGTTVPCSPAFDEAAPAAAHRRRVVFYPNPDQLPARGVRVLLTALQGVSIHEVHLYGDPVADPRP